MTISSDHRIRSGKVELRVRYFQSVSRTVTHQPKMRRVSIVIGLQTRHSYRSTLERWIIIISRYVRIIHVLEERVTRIVVTKLSPDEKRTKRSVFARRYTHARARRSNVNEKEKRVERDEAPDLEHRPRPRYPRVSAIPTPTLKNKENVLIVIPFALYDEYVYECVQFA